MDISLAKKLFYLLDNYSGYFVLHSDDWTYISLSVDNLSEDYRIYSPRDIAAFNDYIDVVLPRDLGVNLRRFMCRSPSA